MSDKQERRYRRLLALYPRDHRERHGEEMLGVLLDGRPGRRDGLDLVGGAIALHSRRVFGLDGGVNRRDVLSIVSLLGPIIMLTGGAADLHEVAWWIKAGDFSRMPFTQAPDAPIWGAWLLVTILALFGQRRAAAVAAWFTTGIYVALTSVLSNSFFWRYEDAGWTLLGLSTAIALTWSPGPGHGRQLVGARGILLAFAGDALAAVILAVTPHLMALGSWAWELGPWLTYGAMALGGYLACRQVRNRRTARRAVFVLALPTVTFVLDAVLVTVIGPPLYWISAVDSAIFYGIPILLVLAGMGILRPVRTRTAV